MKRRSLALAITVFICILADQAIKIIISGWFYNHRINLIGEFVLFSPIYNTKLSWINSWLNIGVGFIPHIILNVLIIVILIFIYGYCSSKYRMNGIVTITYILVLSGAFCSLTDKIFWPGSLDYICLKGFFTFDLKDAYITAGLVLFIIFYIQYSIKNPAVWKMDYKKTILVVKDFTKYVCKSIRPTQK